MSHDLKTPLTEVEKETVPTMVTPTLGQLPIVDRAERLQNALQKHVDQNKVQFLPRFDEYLGGATFDAVTGQYAEVSPERKAEIEKRVGELGELMAGADFGWWLDGAINISLYRQDGNFIRDHKDVDMSVSVDNLSALEKQLHARGYAIVFSDRDRYTETQRCLEVVSADEIKQRNLGELQIARVDMDGKINGEFDHLNFIDLHVLQRDADGSVTIPYSTVTFPKEYFETDRTYIAKNGRPLNLSHPAIVAYHKIESGRDYDFSDISLMKDELTAVDIHMLEGVFQKEPERILERYAPSIKKAFEQINPEMSDEEIVFTLEQTGISNDPDAALFIKNFPQYLREYTSIASDDFVQLLFSKTKAPEKLRKSAQIKIDKLYAALGKETQIEQILNQVAQFNDQIRAEIILVSEGEKPAALFSLMYQPGAASYTHEDYEHDIDLLNYALEKMQLPHNIQRSLEGDEGEESISYAVATDEKTLQLILNAKTSEDHGRYLGYPESAVTAFVAGRSMNIQELGKLRESYPDAEFFDFLPSSDHWLEELELVKKWSAAVRRKAPILHANILQVE